MKISIALLVINEENNIIRCLESVKWADEIIVTIDSKTTDNTEKLAKKYTNKIYTLEHQDNFHINKQKTLEYCTGDWILQMDADEAVSPALQEEIKKVLTMTTNELEEYEKHINKLLARHQISVENRDGKIGDGEGEYTAFFIPRLNFFLGRFLKRGGVYPDGVIRLIKNGKASFPAKSVHEQINIKGRVGWLNNNLLHYADVSFKNYIYRFNRYTDLEATTIKGGFITNFIIQPLFNKYQGFLYIYFRHLGFLDGLPGFVWALFSSLHFPVAYLKSVEKKYAHRSS